MRKELEALVVGAANALGWAVCPSIARGRVESLRGVPSAFVLEGNLVPTTQEKAHASGYYPIGQFRRTVEPRVLGVEADDLGDGKIRYSIIELSPNGTGVCMPFGMTSMSYREVCEKLRAIATAAQIVREQEMGKAGRRAS